MIAGLRERTRRRESREQAEHTEQLAVQYRLSMSPCYREVIRDKLLLRFMPRIKGLARSMLTQCCPTIDTEDLVSAGSIEFINVLEKYDPDRSQFSAYATRMLRYGMINELRAHGVKQVLIQRGARQVSLEGQPPILDRESLPGDWFRDFDVLVEKAKPHLTDQQLSIVVLRYVWGYNLREVARVLKFPEKPKDRIYDLHEEASDILFEVL